jgi:hypothetical protein
MRWALGLVPLCGGCSLLLDFSPKAAPADAAIDAPYNHSECQYMEPNDTIATATAISPGVDTGPAAVCPLVMGVDDLDFYKFTVPAGTTKVTVTSTFQNKLGDLDMKLYNAASEAVVAASLGFTDGETITCPGSSPPCPTLSPGDYVFEVYGAEAGVTNAYTFAVALQ